jgi:AhpC/TSA family
MKQASVLGGVGEPSGGTLSGITRFRMTTASRLGPFLLCFSILAFPAGFAPLATAAGTVEPGAAARDLDGRPVNPLSDRQAKAVVLIFVSTDCPVANRYAPEIEHLYESYGPKHVNFWLVYADRRDDAAKIRTHLHDYRYKVSALRDPEHHLVKRCGATRTPEAALFTAEGKQVYRGRIDDRFTGYGKSRKEPSRRDLQAAINEVLAGRAVKVASTDVIGCFIPDLDP